MPPEIKAALTLCLLTRFFLIPPLFSPFLIVFRKLPFPPPGKSFPPVPRNDRSSAMMDLRRYATFFLSFSHSSAFLPDLRFRPFNGSPLPFSYPPSVRQFFFEYSHPFSFLVELNRGLLDPERREALRRSKRCSPFSVLPGSVLLSQSFFFRRFAFLSMNSPFPVRTLATRLKSHSLEAGFVLRLYLV